MQKLIGAGDTCIYKQEYSKARVFYDSAIARAKDATNSYLIYLATYKQALSYMPMKELDKAIDLFMIIKDEFQPNTYQDSILDFLVDRELDILNLNYLSISYNHDSIQEIYSTYRNDFPNTLKISAYCTMGWLDFHKRQNDAAIENFEYALKICPEAPYIKEHIIWQLSRSHMQKGNFKKSIDYLERLLDEPDVDHSIYEKKSYLANNYVRLRDYQKSISIYSDILADTSLNTVPTYLWVESLTFLAMCYLNLGEFEKAGLIYSRIPRIDEIDDNLAGILLFHHTSWVRYCIKIKDFEKAKQVLGKANNLIDNYNVHIYYVVQYFKRLSWYFFENGQYDKAIEAVDHFEAEYGGAYAAFRDIRSRKQYFTLLQNKYLSYQGIWEDDSENVESLLKAQEGFNEIINQSSNLLDELMSEQTKYEFVRLRRSYFENIFLTSYHLYQITNDPKYLNELGYWVEQSKATLFDASIQYRQVLAEKLPQDLIHAKWYYKNKLDNLSFNLAKEQISDSTRKINPIQLRRELSLVHASYDSVLRLERSYLEKLNKVNNKSLVEVQEKLKPNSMVLDYFIFRNNLFLLKVTTDEIKVLKVNCEDNIKQLAIEFRDLIVSQGTSILTKSQLTEYKRVSYKLYSYLLGPVQQELQNKDLFIIPDNELALVPFGALVSDTLGNSFSELNYLMKNNNITELYSINQIFQRQKKLKSTSKVLGIAPDYSNYSDLELSQLPGAYQEVMQLKDYFKGRIYIEDEANKYNFLNKTKGFDIIHLALHTEINNENPDFSQLLFTDEHDPLTLYEVYGYKFDAKLLVLSGCSTGEGSLKTGEGVLNLARIFYFAGINNVIVTKWKISDMSGADLMRRFYKNMKSGTSVGKSLQRAKMEYLQLSDPLYHHPYYWSAYTTMGYPLEVKNTRILFMAIGFGVLVLIVGGFFFERNRKVNK